VRVLGFIEFEGAGDRFEHAVRDAFEVAAFDAGVVGRADAGEDGDLSRRKPGTRRGPKEARPACSGVILARREVRNSRISLRASI
jgi:hypothetical protein